ncbi:MAG: ABC transporter ATP-binding protein [Tissierellia bacterium]|nr:ABC transporter ATP-binding protein [Tissierellia bacterium]
MENLLEVNNLSLGIKSKNDTLKLVEDVSFSLKKGEILGIVGESGCGKSLTCRSIPRLLSKNIEILSGTIKFKNEIISDSSYNIQKIRGKNISMIFQEPTKTLHPLKSIGNQIEEVLKIHTDMTKKERIQRSIELLDMVGIDNPESRLHQYPFQLSGGLCQRVSIAIAVALEPDLIIADEPTTALDISVQKKILNLLKDLNERIHSSIIIVSHDIGVVKEISDRVNIMYCGQIVEQGNLKDILENPLHPYSKALMDCIPTLSTDKTLVPIAGSVPSPRNYPKYCRFYDRCKKSIEECKVKSPQMIKYNESYVRCLRYEK